MLIRIFFHSWHHHTTWGDRPVVLLGILLGIESVNPIYYETIKVQKKSVIIFLAWDSLALVILTAFAYVPSIGRDSWWKT